MLKGSPSNNVFTILKIGVIPLPAAKAAIVLVLTSLASNTKRPFGSATSITSPALRLSLAYTENLPPSTAFIPTVKSVLVGEEQIE